MDIASSPASDDGVSLSSQKDHKSSPSSLPSPGPASASLAALGGSFPGLSQLPQSIFSRAALLHNTSLFSTSSRSMHASNVERLALLRVMSEHLPALETRDTDARTVHKRASVWSEITKKFNATTSVPRNRHQVQTLYKNMKAKAKKYQSRCLDPANSVLERDHVSEMLLSMLNDEYQQRRTVMQQAAIMAFRDDSSNVDFKDHSIARDVSHFLKQELHETPDMNSSTALSPQAGVRSPNSGAGDSNSSCGKAATSSLTNPLEPDSQKLLTSCKKEESLYDFGEMEPAAEGSAPKVELASQRPESVIMQELCYAQYLAKNKDNDKIFPLDTRKDQEQSTSHEADFSSSKKRKISSSDIQEINETAFENHGEPRAESNDGKTNARTGGKPVTDLASFTNVCCSSMHDELLKMKRLEHELKMQILHQELETAREEKAWRKIEHEMRMKIHQSKEFSRNESVSGTQISEEIIPEETLNSIQENELPES